MLKISRGIWRSAPFKARVLRRWLVLKAQLKLLSESMKQPPYFSAVLPNKVSSLCEGPSVKGPLWGALCEARTGKSWNSDSRRWSTRKSICWMGATWLIGKFTERQVHWKASLLIGKFTNRQVYWQAIVRKGNFTEKQGNFADRQSKKILPIGNLTDGQFYWQAAIRQFYWQAIFQISN